VRDNLSGAESVLLVGVIESSVRDIAVPRRVSLREAFEAHYGPLLKLCMALTGKREVAEDIVQDVFVRAAHKIEGLGQEEVRPYLRQAAVNSWRSRLRRLRLERRYTAGVETGSPPEGVEERDEVWSALMRLPNRQRACLVLRFYEDLPEREIARVLRCSIGTVKSHTSRGLTRMEKELTR
jgi:RNA polymerase sigma-70 factor (sigma-E family)